MLNQKILLFNFNKDRQRFIEKLCRSLSIKVNIIKPQLYMQNLGYLAGIQGFTRSNINYSGEDIESEMLVFSGIDSELMDSFLEAFKQSGMSPISLKAIITPTNIFWTPITLYEELEKERRGLS